MRSLFLSLCALLALRAEVHAQSPNHPIIELRIARTAATPGYMARRLADSTFYVSDSILVSDSVIEHAETNWWQGHLIVPIRLAPQAALRVAAATKNHVRDRMAVFLDGEFTAAVIIVDPIQGPALQLELGPPARVDRIAAEISARWPAHH